MAAFPAVWTRRSRMTGSASAADGWTRDLAPMVWVPPPHLVPGTQAAVRDLQAAAVLHEAELGSAPAERARVFGAEEEAAEGEASGVTRTPLGMLVEIAASSTTAMSP